MTEWNEFRNIDLPRIQTSLSQPRILDCRNLYDPREMQRLGFEYVSIGRPTRNPGEESEDENRPSVHDRLTHFAAEL